MAPIAPLTPFTKGKAEQDEGDNIRKKEFNDIPMVKMHQNDDNGAIG